jgi:hypothetical protein
VRCPPLRSAVQHTHPRPNTDITGRNSNWAKAARQGKTGSRGREAARQNAPSGTKIEQTKRKTCAARELVYSESNHLAGREVRRIRHCEVTDPRHQHSTRRKKRCRSDQTQPACAVPIDSCAAPNLSGESHADPIPERNS